MSEGFDYGNARVRARRADLFGAARYQEFLGLDLNRLLASLSDTPYRPDLETATPRYRGTRLFDEALRTNLARTLRNLLEWYDGAAAAELALIVGRWDVRNVRTILRGHYARVESGEIRAALVPAGVLGDDVLGELAGQSGLRPTVELMVSWGVPTPEVARAVASGLTDFETTGNFQALERTLDRAAAYHLHRALKDAHPEVTQILRSEIDRANLLTVLRLHHAGSAHEEWDPVDPTERFLPGGLLPLTLLSRVARTENRTAAIDLLRAAPVPPTWQPALERWGKSGDVAIVGNELDEIFTRAAAGMFATADPLGPGVPLAYVWAKENEVKNLRTIGAGLAAGALPDTIEEDLVILW